MSCQIFVHTQKCKQRADESLCSEWRHVFESTAERVLSAHRGGIFRLHDTYKHSHTRVVPTDAVAPRVTLRDYQGMCVVSQHFRQKDFHLPILRQRKVKTFSFSLARPGKTWN